MRSVGSRISPHIVKRIKDICNERVTYGYRRIWALLRNEWINLNQKAVLKIMKSENVYLEAHVHKNRRAWGKLFHPDGLDKLWETDLIYIRTINEGMIYLFNLKNCFTKTRMG